MPGSRRPKVMCVAWRRRNRKQFPLHFYHFPRGVFTDRGIETAVLLFLPVFVAVRIFTDIPLLLCNLTTNCLPKISLRGNLFTSRLPGNDLTCHSMFVQLNNNLMDGGKVKWHVSIHSDLWDMRRFEIFFAACQCFRLFGYTKIRNNEKQHTDPLHTNVVTSVNTLPVSRHMSCSVYACLLLSATD
jgi:hypothetical protein